MKMSLTPSCSGTPRRIRGRLAGLALLGTLAVHASASAQTPPPNFGVEDVLTGLEQPTAVRFLPDGRMLTLLKQGQILIADVSTAPAAWSPYMDLGHPLHVDGIQGDQERGLLDVELDPAFPTEPYLYVFYTPATGNARIARFTHAENGGGLSSQGVLASEVVLWQDTDPYDSCCHYGGSLNFGPDGNLWLTTGDHFQGSYAASLAHAGGGLIRIARDGSIPADNPFADGNGPNFDSKFCYGLRNPFRSCWDLPTGRFFIGEVGGNTQMIAWEDLHVLRFDQATGRFVDGDFGTASDDGVFDGINFGWPTVEGLPPHVDFPAADIEPIGEPIFAYRHDGNFASITGGVVYRGTRFPSEYDGAYFYGDSTRDFIRYLKFAPDGSVLPNPSPAPLSVKNPDAISHPFDLFAHGQIVFLEVGPDEALYYVSFNDAGGSGQVPPEPGAVRRYVYAPDNRAPLVQLGAAPQAGLPPLEVDFTIEATDLDGDALSFSLDFDDGQTPASGSLEDGVPLVVSHTFTEEGPYHCVLEVSDGIQTASASRTIAVGTPPVVTQLISTNSRPEGLSDVFRFGDVMTFAAEATDAEDGDLPGETFTWSVAFIRPGAAHPAFGPETGTTSIQFPIPTQGQGFSGPVFYRCFLTVRDGSGLTTTETLDIFPDKVDIDFDSVPQGIAIQVNGNTTRITPFTLDTLIAFDHVITAPESRCLGGTQYEFAGWSNGPVTPQQVYTAPEVPTTLIAQYTAVGPCDGPPVDGLVMHLDASQGVVLDGGSVVAWLDQTPNANDLTAAGSPVLLPGEFNGESAVHLDGIEAALGRTGFTGLPLGSDDRSLFLVGRYNAANPIGPGWAGLVYGDPSANNAFGLALTPAGILGVQGWGGADFPSNPPTNGVGGLLSQSAIYEGGFLTQYLTGAPIGTVGHLFSTDLGSIRLGEELGGGKNLDMDVAEVLVYDHAVSEVERVEIEAYFEDRYQIVTGGGNPPIVRITAPDNGTFVFTFELPLLLEATAADFEDGDLATSIVWTSNVDGVLGTGPSLSTNLSLGTHVIAARAEDSSLLLGVDEVELIVTNEFDQLITGGLVLHLESDQGVTFASGTTVASWQDASPLGNHLSAAGNPQWVTGTTPSGKPSIHFDGNGDELLRVHATDPLAGFPAGNANRTMFVVARYLGSSAWGGVSYGTPATNQAFGLTVKDPTGELVLQGYGSADLVSSSPGIGQGWLTHSGLLRNGTARLFRDGEPIAQWNHGYQTALGRLVVGSELGGFGFITADIAAVLVYNRSLAPGERASVEAYLHEKYLAPNTPPIVSVLTPPKGALFAEGELVEFTATALDKQDGDLGASIAWSSSLDGPLGTGTTLATAALSRGTHTITAAVTDSGLQSGSGVVVVTIDARPVVVVTSPLDGSVHPKDGSIDFAATATDTEEGDLSAALQWSSDLDGALGTGASFARADLTPGLHTITASVTDGPGLVGTQAITLTVDALPQVTITSPADGSLHAEGAEIAFAATATDLEEGDLSAALLWSSSLDGALGTGASFARTDLTPGVHEITAAVTDGSGFLGMDTLSVTIDALPQVTITSPVDGSIHAQGDELVFAATATDTEEGDLSAALQWSSDLDGALGTGASFARSDLTPGLHTITASVTDGSGLAGQDALTLTVDTRPEVTISSPADGSVHVLGSEIVFSATALDAEQGDLGAALVWSSSLDGQLGSGASVSRSDLSSGQHTITASVTDGSGFTGMDTLVLTVDARPEVTIVSPADGSVHALGGEVEFLATAKDLEDGDLGAALTWSSSLDGPIGTGASFTTSALSVGNHLVTASVSDGSGLMASEAVTIRVMALLPTQGLVLRLESTTGVTPTGADNAVAGWSDQSGSGNHLEALGGPTLLRGATPSSRPAVSLDGVDDRLLRLHAVAPLQGLPSGNADRTMFVLSRYKDLTWSAGVAYGTGASNQTFGVGVRHTNGFLMLQGWGYDHDLVSTTPALNADWIVHSAVLSAGVATLFKDDKPIAEWAHTYDTVLSRFIIGQEIADLGFIAMDVAAVLVYDRALSPEERAVVDAYLQETYLAPNTPPEVTILAPGEGTLRRTGIPITFTAQAMDAQEADLSAELLWSSSLDGPIGTGASFTTAALSAGTHLITASVADAGDATGADTLTLVVSNAPRSSPAGPPLGSASTPKTR